MKKEQERLYNIYKDFGVTREYIQGAIDDIIKLGESLEYALSAVKVTLAIAFTELNEFTLDDYAVFSKKTPFEAENVFNQLQEELLIANKYKDKGVNVFMITELVSEGLKKGFTRKAILAGIRMALGMEYDKHEYFTTDESAEILNISETEAESMLENYYKETVNSIGITKTTFSKYLQ